MRWIFTGMFYLWGVVLFVDWYVDWNLLKWVHVVVFLFFSILFLLDKRMPNYAKISLLLLIGLLFNQHVNPKKHLFVSFVIICLAVFIQLSHPAYLIWKKNKNQKKII